MIKVTVNSFHGVASAENKDVFIKTRTVLTEENGVNVSFEQSFTKDFKEKKDYLGISAHVGVFEGPEIPVSTKTVKPVELIRIFGEKKTKEYLEGLVNPAFVKIETV